MDLDDVQTLDRYKRHTIEVVVDRLVVRHADDEGKAFGPENPNPERARFSDSVETALRLGEGVLVVGPADAGAFEEQRYSEKYSCPFDGYTIDELEPRSFSFNSPHGACPSCTGLGVRMEFDPERMWNLSFPGPGDYSIRILVDGSERKRLPLVVEQREQAPGQPQGKSGNAPPFPPPTGQA